MAFRRLWLFFAFIILFSPPTYALDNPHTSQIDPVDLSKIMLVKDIKPGMKGYGKTVFRGTKPETFQVEVLGVLPNIQYGTDQILIKMSGGPMTKRGANLIQGMSGSPIYINGKIIGAVAYGEALGKEPIALATPIEYMLETWDRRLPDKPSSFYPFTTSNLEKPVALSGQTFGKVAIDYGEPGRKSYDAGTLVFRPLATPLMVSSMSPRATSFLQEKLKPFNVQPMAGPGRAADKANASPEIGPGSTIGVSLATGDLDLTVIGTVTYRRGNNILAFGHPMFGLGAVDALVTTAYVYDIYPSLFASSMMAAPVKPIGRLLQDQMWAVSGEIGKLPNMIPITVNVTDLSLGRKKKFQANVINHPLLTPIFAVSACAEAIFEARSTPSDVTARVKLEVVADEVGTITRENTYFDSVSIDMESVSELDQILNLLQFNPFYPVSAKKITMSVEIVGKHQTARLERIFLKEGKFKPGDTVEIGAVLVPFKGERVTKTIALKLPKNLPNGRLPLVVSGGKMAHMPFGPQQEEAEIIADPGFGMGMGPSPAMPSVENLQQLIKKFLDREKNNDLVARILLPETVPSIAGEKLSNLPPSIAEAMKSSKTTMLGTEREQIKEIMPTDWVITGMQRLSITVQKADKGDKSPPEKRMPEPPAEESPEDGPTDLEEMPDETMAVVLSTETDGIRLETLRGSELLKVDAEDKEAQSITPSPDKASDKEEKPADQKEAKPQKTTPADEKPVGRAPGVWKQTSRAEFLKGTLDNVAATTGDLVTLAGSLNPLYESPETYVWCILPDGKGNVYVGTGNHGIVYKVSWDGSASVLYDSPEIQVHSLATDSAGNVYAGTSPNGIVYRIDSEGKASILFDAEEKYIVALATDSEGNLYAATGDKCKVYRISPDGQAKVALDSSEAHALSLAVDKDSNVYVGTGLNGIIYRISASGDVTVRYDAAESSVTALAIDSKGVLFAGTSPKGVIYKLPPNSTPKVVYDKAGKGITGMCVGASDEIFAVNSADVFKIMADETVCVLSNERDLQFLSVAASDGRLYAGTGNIGSVYCAEIGNTIEGKYESPVHDCKLASNWGVIEWTANLPKGTSIVLQTRTGYVAEPDSTWSNWSAPCTSPGTKVVSPPGRYIQYLATLKTENATVKPEIKDVSIMYLPENQPPKVTLAAPKGGERWSKKKTIKWKGTDPDKDTLTYDLFYSSDGGNTWLALGDKITPSKSPAKEEPQEEPSETEDEEVSNITVTSPDPQELLAEMAAELDKHPEIPQEMKDQIMNEAAASLEEEDETNTVEESPAASEETSPEEKPSGNGVRQTSFAWDTTKVQDGTYLIKVVGSDWLSNPLDPLTHEAISEPVVVANTAPRIFALKKTLTIQTDKRARVEGLVYNDLVGIAGVQYRTGNGDWAAAAASDGIFDSTFEGFTVLTQPLAKGEHVIELKAIDQAGNAASTKLTAKVE